MKAYLVKCKLIHKGGKTPNRRYSMREERLVKAVTLTETDWWRGWKIRWPKKPKRLLNYMYISRVEGTLSVCHW